MALQYIKLTITSQDDTVLEQVFIENTYDTLEDLRRKITNLLELGFHCGMSPAELEEDNQELAEGGRE